MHFIQFIKSWFDLVMKSSERYDVDQDMSKRLTEFSDDFRVEFFFES